MLYRFRAFFHEMDTRRWRAAAATAVILIGLTAVFLVGKAGIGPDVEARVEGWLAGFAGSPWALVVTILLFTLTAFIGAPQFLLIAACVVAFGPWLGFTYAWVATIVSAAVTYYVGRLAGGRFLDRLGGRTVGRLRGFVSDNAFSSSFIIRNVPSAPFIVVNMAFGAARAPLLAFLAGCALGSIPKTALIAFFGGSVMTAVEGDGVWSSAILAGIGFLALAVSLGFREWMKRRRQRYGDFDPNTET
ncbi:VTT domain-containing protein [Brevundimonas sp. 2R-24]|uniref:TVP38/TMEM64 family membrane protein n=1 Tax=Peiella sedimenti TaxID=3061083 RepID=A0ABT8SI30_9CAUL|nr:VTT domain-containing protein [Caulobacteraceae bacterium XZ-24]